jgi:hypothetical protein
MTTEPSPGFQCGAEQEFVNKGRDGRDFGRQGCAVSVLAIDIEAKPVSYSQCVVDLLRRSRRDIV